MIKAPRPRTTKQAYRFFFVGAVALVAFATRAAPAADLAEQFPEAAELYAAKCRVCHTIGEGTRIGPDLMGVTRRREREWLMGYIPDAPTYHETDPLARDLLIEHERMQMPVTELTGEEVAMLLDYTDAHDRQMHEGFESTEQAEPLGFSVEGPSGGRGVSLPGIAAAALLLAGGAGLWRTRRPASGKVMIVLALGAAYLSLGGRAQYRLPANDQGYEPQQPIAYSHKLHAGDLRISCLYCHGGAEKGARAGVPSVATCMNCHSVVRSVGDSVEPSPEIAKLVAAWATRETDEPEPIEWVRVHSLPDFVQFDHQAHVTNGIQCQKCHGPVQEMERIRQASTLSMGWCIDCHRMTRDEAPDHWKRAGATRDCSACHY